MSQQDKNCGPKFSEHYKLHLCHAEKQVDGKSVDLTSKKYTADCRCQHRLENITSQNTDNTFCPISSVKIGQPRITAAMHADIIAKNTFRNQDRAIDTAQQIGNCRSAKRKGNRAKNETETSTVISFPRLSGG